MNNAQLKIARASKHIDELKHLFSEKHLFTYVVETNTQTGERATFAKKNEAIINQSKLIIGDIIHNLRSAIDYAYWEIVSPFVDANNSQKSVQFPFCEREEFLEKTVKKRHAGKVSDRFLQAIIALKPYKGPGGNELLTLIHELDILDKHKFPTPVGNYTKLSSKMIQKQVPDFPTGLNIGFANCHRDAVWHNRNLDHINLGKIVPPTTYIFEKELDVPVSVNLEFTENGYSADVIETLNNMRVLIIDTINIMKKSI